MKNLLYCGFLSLIVSLNAITTAQAQCDSSYTSQFLQAGQWLGNLVFGQVEISEQQEEEIGEEMYGYIQENFKLLKGNQAHQRLQKILNRLVPYVQRPGITYEIHLVDDDELINAFSIAGGHLFITTGIMKWVESEDELAFIIAHEMSHVDAGHTIQHVKKSVTIQSWADYLEVGEYASDIEQVQSLLGLPFGQPDEYEADRLGAYLVWKAGYDPHRGKNFFIKLSQNEERQNLPYDLDVWLRTHPYSDQRIRCLEYFIDRELK